MVAQTVAGLNNHNNPTLQRTNQTNQNAQKETINVSPYMTYPCIPGTQSAILHAMMQQRNSATAQIK
jgi:hypothetical protein